MFTCPASISWQMCSSNACRQFPGRLNEGREFSLLTRTGRPLQLSPCQGLSAGKRESQAELESSEKFTKELISQTEVKSAALTFNISLNLETLGPFFRARAFDLHSKEVIGVAQGCVKIWTCGRILHLDSIRLSSLSIKVKRPLFGIAFLLGALVVCHGYDMGCVKAELLAIKDTDTYHSKLVRYYLRMGFRSVYEVTGETLEDIPHMLVWGGVGTRMDANIEELLLKWSSALKKVLQSQKASM
ncbi:hypothetical protein KP509_19G037500 [Ceratopteris richardii]|uniref:Uncharacterized protein n=1 Tax=Ceratopteris richardii TaxID=49495 RepID=A0A8T2SJB3_CERRI|nr:hypothetical protein KP509_19G037500 [Ceratopteris richardii]KAH7352267.1 hypothetical protein KP509_19G037500 [Ceratopteris richardii]